MRVISEDSFACLTYHEIGEGPSQYTLSEIRLLDQLAFLKAEGYVVDGFEQLEARLRSGKGVPTHYVILTVDDGRQSSMRAMELLETYGFHATFFVTRDWCSKEPGFIREPEIRELRKRGFSLGTHGTTHRKLTFVPQEDCVEELKGSKQWLEDVLGEEVRYMAAPGGYLNPRVLQLAYDCGYVLIGTCKEWMNSLHNTTLPGKLNRVNIRQRFTPKDFRSIVEGHPGFYLWRQARAATLAIPKQVLR